MITQPQQREDIKSILDSIVVRILELKEVQFGLILFTSIHEPKLMNNFAYMFCLVALARAQWSIRRSRR